MTISKVCQGCNSNKTIFQLSYYQCKSYLSTKDIYLHILFKEYNLQKIFRDDYCPCTQCLVKPTCKDPKMNIQGVYSKTTIGGKHQCELFNTKVEEYQTYIIKYLQEKNQLGVSIELKV